MDNPIVTIKMEHGLIVVYENDNIFAAINPAMISHVGLSDGRCKVWSIASSEQHAIGLPKEAINEVIHYWKASL